MMILRVARILLGVVLLIPGDNCAVDMFTKKHEHLSSCYNATGLFLPSFQRPAQSLENLVAIVEKIEQQSQFMPMRSNQLALYILSRFRVDGITKKIWVPDDKQYPVTNLWEKDAESQLLQDLQMKILNDGDYEYINLPVNFLSEKEKCGLHWMLSHTINETKRPEELINPIQTPPPWVTQRRSKRQSTGYDSWDSRYPLEGGVMQTPYGTVAPAPLLAGIATLATQRTSVLLSLLIGTGSETELDSSIRGASLNVRFGAFVSLARAACKGSKLYRVVVGPGGWWNSTYCPNEYTLTMPPSYYTEAQLYGSLDGYFIASKMLKNDVSSQFSSIKLSQILRMYYGQGISSDLRGCNRMKMLKDEYSKSEFKENLAKLIVVEGYNSLCTSKSLSVAQLSVNQIIETLRGNYTESSTQQQKQCMDTTDEPKAVPVVDLYVVMDSSYLLDYNSMKDIAFFMGGIGSYLDIGPRASHIGLYVNDARMFNEILPMNRTQSEAMFKCKVGWLDPTKLLYNPQGNNIEMIQSLKKLMNEEKFSEENRKNVSTPGKVVLLILNNRNTPRREDLRWQMDLFRRDHPEVRFFLAGSNTDADIYLTDTRNDNLGYLDTQSYQSQISEKLFRRLQTVGSNMYAPDCFHANKDASFRFSSYIANNTVRYHTMFSNNFNISTDLRIQVRGTSYPLTACISRDTDIFDPVKRVTCYNIPYNSPGVYIYYDDPCSSRYCPPIYIRITTGIEGSSAPPITFCNRPECKTADEILYEISVTGARCGSSVARLAVGLAALGFLLNHLMKSYFA